MVLTVSKVEIVPLMPNIDVSGIMAGIERDRSCKLSMKLSTHTIYTTTIGMTVI
jgi:hypothetical protein